MRFPDGIELLDLIQQRFAFCNQLDRSCRVDGFAVERSGLQKRVHFACQRVSAIRDCSELLYPAYSIWSVVLSPLASACVESVSELIPSCRLAR